MIADAMRRLVHGHSLSPAEARDAVLEIMSGTVSDTMTSAFLVSLKMKGETADEILGVVQAMREKSEKFLLRKKNAIDTCGTGGDTSGTFNISTAAAILAAASGVTVAKHGNRSVSSRCGSADVLEKLGIKIDLTKEKSEVLLHDENFTFLFAPAYHKAMKFVAPIRKELGLRTIFNMVGPLTNPAGVKRQVIGVYNKTMTQMFATVLRELDAEHILIVHGETDTGATLDEASICGTTWISELKRGSITSYKIRPEDFGFKRHPLAAIAGGDLDENAAIVRHVFEGNADDAKRDAVLLSAGLACYIANAAETIESGITLAKTNLENGNGLKKLNSLIESSKKL
jgi:anthranilate phosphoribosyltransferase